MEQDRRVFRQDEQDRHDFNPVDHMVCMGELEQGNFSEPKQLKEICESEAVIKQDLFDPDPVNPVNPVKKTAVALPP